MFTAIISKLNDLELTFLLLVLIVAGAAVLSSFAQAIGRRRTEPREAPVGQDDAGAGA